MKRLEKIMVLFCFCIITTALVLEISGGFALAEESTGSWRSTYDHILLWVNFSIIVFLIIKYAKTPLMNFLRGEKEDIAKKIEKIETEKNSINARLKEAENKIKDSKDHIKILKEKIIRKGKKGKQDIIEDAHQQSISMIENSKQKIENLIQQKKNSFRIEMIDTAFDMANKKIPLIINEKDNKKLLETYLENAKSK